MPRVHNFEGLEEDEMYVTFLRRKDVRKSKFRKEKDQELKEKEDAKRQKLQKGLRAGVSD